MLLPQHADQVSQPFLRGLHAFTKLRSKQGGDVGHRVVSIQMAPGKASHFVQPWPTAVQLSRTDRVHCGLRDRVGAMAPS